LQLKNSSDSRKVFGTITLILVAMYYIIEKINSNDKRTIGYIIALSMTLTQSSFEMASSFPGSLRAFVEGDGVEFDV
jgi:hypothetical protein